MWPDLDMILVRMQPPFTFFRGPCACLEYQTCDCWVLSTKILTLGQIIAFNSHLHICRCMEVMQLFLTAFVEYSCRMDTLQASDNRLARGVQAECIVSGLARYVL